MDEPSTNNQEYVSVSLNNRETIDGKTLTVTAYTAIFVLLIFYVASIFFRERKVIQAAEQLKNRLKNKTM